MPLSKLLPSCSSATGEGGAKWPVGMRCIVGALPKWPLARPLACPPWSPPACAPCAPNPSVSECRRGAWLGSAGCGARRPAHGMQARACSHASNTVEGWGQGGGRAVSGEARSLLR